MIDIINEIIPIIRQGLPCLFQLITGLYCPGCGGTRAAVYLLHGQFKQSLLYHPLVPYMALIIIAETISWLLSKLCKNPQLHIKHYNFFVYIGVIITVLNFLWKNYVLLTTGTHLLPL